MAIFTGTTRSNGYDPAYESYGNAIGGGMDALIEGFSDELAVIEAMHALDMAEIELTKKVRSIRESAESEEEEVDVEEEIKEAEESYVVATEASMKDIWAKIKAWFKKLWEKVKAFFAGLIRGVAAFILTPKAFLKQYRDKLNALKNFEVKVKTYEYDKLEDAVNNMAASVKPALMMHVHTVDTWVGSKVMDVRSANLSDKEEFAGSETQYLELVEKIEEDQKDLVEKFVKSVTGSDDVEEFSTNVYEKLRGGKEPKEITITDVKPYIAIIEKSAGIVDSLKKVEKSINDHCSKLNAQIEKEAKESEKPAEGKATTAMSRRAACMRKSISGYSQIQSLVNRFVSISVSVVREACGASKHILSAAMSPKAAK